MLGDVITSLTLITRLPLGFLNAKRGDLGRSAIHFPLAGYISFTFWFASYKLAFFLSSDPYIAVCFSLVIVYYFFNLFHFDGFLDSIDGLLSQKPKIEALDIMKRGNIGPTAMFFGTVYLILKVYLAVKLDILMLLPVFVIARWGMSYAAAISRPASESGLGATLTYGKPVFFAVSTVYIALLPFLRDPLMIGMMAVAVILVDLLLVKTVERSIGGLTGDNFGLINETNELLLMIIAFIFTK